MKVLVILLLFPVFSFANLNQLKSRLSNFRDPFRKKIMSADKAGQKGGTRKSKTFFSNRVNPLSISLEKLEVVGVYLGTERRAIGRVLGDDSQPKGGDNTFIIKEGMKIGPDRAEVKAILPAGIVLVEKIVNVYDEVEYLETVIPVSE